MTAEQEIAAQWQSEMPGPTAEDKAILANLHGSPDEQWKREFARLVLGKNPRNRKLTISKDYMHWQKLGYEPHEVKLWFDAGAGMGEVELVRALIWQGINPKRARDVIQHPQTGDSMTILQFARNYQAVFSSIGKALDAAGVARQMAWKPGVVFGRAELPPSIKWPDE